MATIKLDITQSPTALTDTGIRVTAWVCEAAQDSCPGVQNITVEPDTQVYHCLYSKQLVHFGARGCLNSSQPVGVGSMRALERV